jgi:hypothetical protein
VISLDNIIDNIFNCIFNDVRSETL